MDCQPCRSRAFRGPRRCRPLGRVLGGWLVAAVGLFGGGCLKHEEIPASVMLIDPPKPSEIHPASAQPKRSPKANTCLAFAEFRESLANDPRLSPEEIEKHRLSAVNSYRESIQLDPTFAPAYSKLARLQSSMGQPQEAVRTFQAGIVKCPKDAGLHYDFGMLYARLKLWDESLGELRRATELDPGSAPLATQYGFCLARAGRFDASFEVLQHHRGVAQAHLDVARMMYHLKQEDLGEAHAREALKAQPDLPLVSELLAQITAERNGQPTPTAQADQAAAPAPPAQAAANYPPAVFLTGIQPTPGAPGSPAIIQQASAVAPQPAAEAAPAALAPANSVTPVATPELAPVPASPAGAPALPAAPGR